MGASAIARRWEIFGLRSEQAWLHRGGAGAHPRPHGPATATQPADEPTQPLAVVAVGQPPHLHSETAQPPGRHRQDRQPPPTTADTARTQPIVLGGSLPAGRVPPPVDAGRPMHVPTQRVPSTESWAYRAAPTSSEPAPSASILALCCLIAIATVLVAAVYAGARLHAGWAAFAYWPAQILLGLAAIAAVLKPRMHPAARTGVLLTFNVAQ